MAVDMCRFTAWLSETERGKLDEIARANGTSVNLLVRLAIRQFVGLPTPPSQLSHVTNTTPMVEGK